MNDSKSRFSTNVSETFHTLNKLSSSFVSLNQNGRHYDLVLSDQKIGIFKPAFAISKDSIEDTLLSEKPIVFILIQAGAAALAVVKGGQIIKSKIFKRYMVRKSQGKNQLKHLTTKGKSRLGSRIRLQQSEKFFTEINQKLSVWRDDLASSSRIIYSCSDTLWPILFEEKYNPTIKKTDSRFFKLPLDIQTPNLSVLNYVVKVSLKSIWEIDSKYIHLL